MTRFVALLRAVNVGGTGLLPMSELAALCAGLGHRDVRTYIASGNVLLSSSLGEAELRAGLAQVLAARMGKPVEVMVRTGAEMQAVCGANPFPAADPKKLLVAFLHEPPPADVLAAVRHREDEELILGAREIYIHYPRGMARARLALPPGLPATGRNFNTVAKLAALAG